MDNKMRPNGNARKKMKRFKEKNESVCFYCKKPILNKEFKTVDHKQALSQGGSNKEENFVIACADCNNEKRAMSVKEYDNYLFYKEYLRELSKEEQKKKEEMFLSLLRKKESSVYLRKALGRKMKALKEVQKEEIPLQVRKQEKIRKMIDRITQIQHLLIGKENSSFVIEKMNKIKSDFYSDTIVHDQQLIPYYNRLEELMTTLLNHPNLNKKHMKNVQIVKIICANHLASIEIKKEKRNK